MEEAINLLERAVEEMLTQRDRLLVEGDTEERCHTLNVAITYAQTALLWLKQ